MNIARRSHRLRLVLLAPAITIFITACSSGAPGPESTAIAPIEPTASATIEAADAAEAEPTAVVTTEPIVVPTPDEAFRQLAETGVATNEEWTAYTEVFNGIEMALVPAGCFMMGSEDGEPDESPAHSICFEAPYWIDVTEVTNGAYGSSGHWSGSEQPRESIGWADADAHCQMRGARLPTEAEWEYAARGASNLIYPWGDEFIADNVVYDSNARHQTAKVGSRPGGVSWIGAYDLSGNVSEWVSDSYDPDYYGSLMEGTVNPQGSENGTDPSLLRGGYFAIGNPIFLRAAYRGTFSPSDLLARTLGVRCARSYD